MKRMNNLTTRLLLVILPVVVGVLVLFAAQCKNLYRSMTEEEICRAVITLMDSEVTLSYDGEEFKAYEIV